MLKIRILSFITSLLFLFGMVIIPGISRADFSISVIISPPELPVYVQPEAPAPDYIWAPGYWAYSSNFEGYYWVPGTWVEAPYAGLLWTPGYWHWGNGQYFYSDGYWGAHIGFYGGINYGHGYGGTGTSSFNGGPGGTNAKPTFEEQAAMKEKHIPATAEQKQQVRAASKNRSLRASVNHGKPSITATARPGVFKGKGVVAARQAEKETVVRHAKAAQHKKTPSHAKPKPKAHKKSKVRAPISNKDGKQDE